MPSGPHIEWLTVLDFDEIKIDRIFIANIDDPVKRALLVSVAESDTLTGRVADTGRAPYRFNPEYSSQILFRVFRYTSPEPSGESYPAAPADGLFRAPGRPAFPAGRGSALPVRTGAVSAEGCRQGEVLFISQ